MSFVLAHLSDPHLAPLPRPRLSELCGKRVTGYVNWRRNRRFLHDRASLDLLAADLKAQHTDHIAVTGDIVNIAAEAEFAPGAAWLAALGPPDGVSFVPGNHDAYVASGARHAARFLSAFMSGDDGAVGFPYLRRRGMLGLVGLSTGVPTGLGMATGYVGEAQIAALIGRLRQLKQEGRFRVVLIHHPPMSDAAWHKRLMDAALVKRAIATEGAELLLHGHDHKPMLNWLEGPQGTRVPAVGVPSASASPFTARHPAGYNLYRVDGAQGAWSCDMIARVLTPEGRVVERHRMKLF